MRTDTAEFYAKNTESGKDPRYTIEIAFDSAYARLEYVTSHTDSAVPTGASVIYGIVAGISGTTQSINPDQAVSSIGSISFSLVDKTNQVRDLQNTEYALGYSLRGKRVRIYLGYEGLAWADYSLIQTQIIESVTYKDGRYNFLCSDVQRLARIDIFEKAKTNLSADITSTATTINVYDTTAFTTVAHGTSYSDAPSATVGYIRIDDEIIRYTGKTSNTFTGCTRGALNTKAIEHTIDPNASADRRTEVEEVIYLEMPIPKMIYALLTGNLYGQVTGSPETTLTLPTKWHLGISTDYIRLTDFTDTQKADWWDTTDDTAGIIARFVGLDKQDGKKFIEKELLLLLGAFMPVYTDGALGLKRLVRILTDAPYDDVLDESNIVSHSELKHDFQSLHNVIKINWNYNLVKDKTTRTNTLLDTASIAVHGQAKPYEQTFLGLGADRHTLATLYSRFDALRDRYSGPPVRLSVTCLHSKNVTEVGDIKRTKLNTLQDYITGATFDRSCEVQNVAIDWITGKVNLSLFSSSQAAAPAEWSGNATNIADSFYTSAGNNLATYVGGGYDFSTDFSVSGGVGHIIADCQLTGGSTTADAIFYYDGPLQIDAGVTVTITNNVQIRCKGYFTRNGTIDGAGNGLAGASGATSDGQYGDGWHSPGTAGVGTTKPGGGVHLYLGGLYLNSFDGKPTTGKTLEKHDITNISGVVNGLPVDLRGSSGGGGLPIYGKPLTTSLNAAGGAGGAGGAGLLIICRGFAFGAAGNINLSGVNGSAGSLYTSGNISVYAGTGAGGYPGALYIINDGTDVIDQITKDNFIANRGTSVPAGTPTNEVRLSNYAIKPSYSYFTGFYGIDRSHWASNYRVDYAPADETAEDDQTEYPPDVTSFTAMQNGDVTVLRWTEVLYDGELGGYEIRYSPTTINSFADATPLTIETKGTNITTADLPPGTWRMYIKARDRITKERSVNAATATVTVSTSFNVIHQVQQAPAWLGTKTNYLVHHTGKLVVESTLAANAHTNAELFEQHVPYPQSTSTYESPEYDIDFDDTVRVWGDIESVLGPGKTGVANPQLQIDYRLAAGAYGGFNDWSNGLVEARYIKHRFTNDNTQGVAVINGFQPTVDILEHTERVSGISVPSASPAGYAVTFIHPFHTTPYVKADMDDGSAKIASSTNITTTGFTMKVFDLATGNDSSGTTKYEATGE